MLVALIAGPANGSDWSHYGGDQGGTRFSELTQVNRSNVSELRIAWQVRTGAAERRGPLLGASQFQATPIITPAAAGNSVVICTPWNRVIALDPTTGETRWEFDPKLRAIPLYNCRGAAIGRINSHRRPSLAGIASSPARVTCVCLHWTRGPVGLAMASVSAAKYGSSL